MPPSPICLVSDNGGPFNPTSNGLDVNPGDPISIVLESPTGVTNWYLQVGLVIGSPPVVVPGTGTDELQVTPPLLVGTTAAGLVIGGPTSTVTITAFPPAGSALLISSTITGGFGQITTTLALFALTTGGYRVGASGMTREGSTAYGWVPITNAAIRHIGAGGGVTAVTASPPLTSSGGATPDLSLSLPGQTQGDVLYFNGTNWVRLPAGVVNQFLQTQGASANPQWEIAVTSVTGNSPISITGTAEAPAVNLSIAGQTQGDIIYFNGTNWVRLPAGTAGEVLQTQGASADPQWAVAGGGGGGFTDNATAERTRQNSWLRRDENLSNSQLSFNGIPTLTDNALAGNAGATIASIADKVFFVSGTGTLYGYDLLQQLNVAGPNVPLFNYTNGVADLLGVRGIGSGLAGQAIDYLFATLPNFPRVGLGTVQGQTPTMTYTSKYTTNTFVTLSGTFNVINGNAAVATTVSQLGALVPGDTIGFSGFTIYTVLTVTATTVTLTGPYTGTTNAAALGTNFFFPVRACFIGGGDTDPNYGAAFPVFAFGATNGHLYLVGATGTVHDAFSTGDTPGPMFVDDAGYLWVAYTTAKTIVKFSVNLTAFTLSIVQTIAAGVAAMDMISDGRYARAIASVSGVPTLYAWDLQSGAAGPVFSLTGATFGGAAFSYPRDLYYDSATGFVWVADQGNKASALTAFRTSDQSVQHALAVPSLPLGGQLPNTWTGARRVIGDTNYIYVSDPGSGSPFVAIVDKTSGLVVGQITTGAQARDMALDGAGNIYVVNRPNNIQKFNIAAAVAAYPATYSTAGATSPTRAYHVLAYDPSTPAVFGATYGAAGNIEALVSLDPLTLAEISVQTWPGKGGGGGLINGAAAAVSSFATPSATITGLSGMTPAVVGLTLTLSNANSAGNNGTFVITSYISATSVVVNNPAGVAPDYGVGGTIGTPTISWSLQFAHFQYLLSAFGSIWASTNATVVVRVNPATFPALSSVTLIDVSSGWSSGLSADTTDNTILVGDDNLTSITSRISTSSNLQVSSFTPGASSAVFSPTAIWTTVSTFSNHGLVRFTNGVGTETKINTITAVFIPGTTARLAWDGDAIYLAVAGPGANSGG